MWELDCEESWAPKNWCFWTVVLEKTLESPLDCKEIQPVHSKGDQSWVFMEGLMLKLKLQCFGHLMQKADSFEKTLMLWRLKAGGKSDDRGCDGWTASPTHWWTGRRVLLQSMGSQRVGRDWMTKLDWIPPFGNSIYKLNKQWAKLSEIFIENFKVCWISPHLIILL